MGGLSSSFESDGAENRMSHVLCARADFMISLVVAIYLSLIGKREKIWARETRRARSY